MRILIIEDEPKTADFLKKGLSENGYNADVVKNGEEGLYQISTLYYDLVILDVLLPKLDGWTIVKFLRENGNSIPVLMLTCQKDIEDIVKGFDLGADDYLTKPFAFSELLARVRALLKRGPINTSTLLIVSDLKVDLLKRKATRNDVKLNLSAKEFNLLALFMKRKGELLSKTLIAELVWDMNFDSNTNIIEVAVRRLRQKLDDPFSNKLIHTVRGVGYVLDEAWK
jgi:two-component system copper resistance phosphate regulon response regulator CusR